MAAGNVQEGCRWGQPGVLGEGWSQEAWEALDSQWTTPTPTPKPLQPEAEEQLPPPGHKLWSLKQRGS